jgi:hypothetical protein
VKSIKIANFLGGALFAYGLLSFINSVSIEHKSYIVSQLIEARIRETPPVIGETASDLNASSARAELAKAQFALADADRQTNSQQIFLLTATLGAGLACLRESRN